MNEQESLSHSQWECKYDVDFIPKYHRKKPYAALRRRVGEVFKRVAKQKECRIEGGDLLSDPVYILISTHPKYSDTQVIGTSTERANLAPKNVLRYAQGK
jgi:putative transposase